MRKIITCAFLLLLWLPACQNSQSVPDGYYPYDIEKVKSAVRQLSFQPEIPGFVPIPVQVLISDHYQIMDTEAEALDVSFYTNNNDLLSIQFVNGEMDEIMTDSVTVTINERVKGHYIDNSYAKILYWEKNGINYKMIYRSSGGSIGGKNATKEITKSDLVNVAESFHS
ncbi:hypothetical protein [Aquibacillus albus]|uniref:DUF4367 domain-containing protein n=1 Tax=Aquibacillus albus TaxID=1168171 RepID=A0ABS2N0Q3_9BACI|nr:hypothetical protein [Aquibacillus albus]MBM7571623.1 hypothetical protein [Aquibacillus albus]